MPFGICASISSLISRERRTSTRTVSPIPSTPTSSNISTNTRWANVRPRIVLCHGCFDPLHIGHVLHLEAAKRFGEILIVAITDDDYVNKGPRRPVFHVEHRRAMLEALRCVDATMVVKDRKSTSLNSSHSQISYSR